MMQCVLGTQAGGVLDLQEPGKEILGVVGDPMETEVTQVQLATDYVPTYRVFVHFLVIAREGEEAGEEHMEEDAEGPHVGHHRVTLAFQDDLGRAEEQRPVALRASLVRQEEL